MKRLAILAAALAFLAGTVLPERAARVLDDFRDVSIWTPAPSDGVRLELSRQPAENRSALRLDFDFQGRAGWAAARRDLSIDLPENWELSFEIRGAAPANTLEVKLVDPTRENVWWAVRREFAPDPHWQRLRLKKRHFSFAWGPAGGGEMKRMAVFEIAVTAGSGGRGWIEISGLTLTSLPPPGPPPPPPIASASSSLPGFGPERAVDGDASTSWRSRGSGGEWIALDLGERREYGGLTVQWEPGRFGIVYDVQTSDDGATWKTERTVERGNGGRDDLYLPDSESRWLRLKLSRAATGAGYAVREIVVRPLSWSQTPNAFFESIARESPRGSYPRSFSGEQSYWTVVGVEGDTESALVGEDGAVEPSRGSFSVEPFLFEGGRLEDWSSVRSEQSLESGDLPIPRVTWNAGPISLEITAFAFGPPGESALHVRYRLVNTSGVRRRARLFLAVRPFQVNPPAQFLNSPGGVAPIGRIAWNGRAVAVDGTSRIFPEVPPVAFGAVSFDEGPLTNFLAEGKLPPSASASDDFRHAAGALAFDFELAAGAADEVSLRIPFHPSERGAAETEAFSGSRDAARALVSRRLAACARAWTRRLRRVEIGAPPVAGQLLATLRKNLADILLERDGAALRPGTRAYARSWIRDGAMMSEALLRMGHPEVVRAYIDWFARYQQPDGRIPCCVDRRGADPVVENDSHGEFLFLIAEYWRFTGDAEFLRRLLPAVEKSVEYLDMLRARRRTPEFTSGEKRAFFGLLPESISHEGYSAKPVHSYWDDFWALSGLKGAVTLARAAGRDDLARRWSAILDEFAADLHASIVRTIESRGIEYIPGSAELADFDPTSTTIALDPAGELGRLSRSAVLRTFERYYAEFLARRDGKLVWDAYTPYEIRTVGAFVRLGWRERAQELLDFFLTGRRPAGWNEWAEVVGRESRTPRFVGDMPHAWVGSDFIRSVLDLFAFEREADGALVLGAGLPAGWLRGGGVRVRRLRTPHGLLDYRVRTTANEIRFSVSSGLTIPPGGVVLSPPLSAPRYRVTVNGRRVAFSGEELALRRLPADVLFRALARE